MTISFENIPQELKERPNWVLWRSIERDGKPTKVPFIADGSGWPAKSDDSKTWRPFEDAKSIFESGGFAGIGYVFEDDDPFVGIDLDHCKPNGKWAASALVLVKAAGTYAEVSPSREGIKVVAEGRRPDRWRNGNGVEVYDHRRFFTITGSSLGNSNGIAKVDVAELLKDSVRDIPVGTPKVLPAGERHNTLRQALISSRQLGMDEEELLATGRTLSDKRGAGSTPNAEIAEIVTWVMDNVDLGIHLTDSGNATRFALKHREQVKYVDDWKTYVVWDGKCWAIDRLQKIKALAQEVLMAMYGEAGSQQDAELREKLGKWATKSESRAMIDNMLSLAQPLLAALPESFDTDPWALNCLNGILNLRTGELTPHDPDRLFTKLANVEFDPEAKCPKWRSAIKLWTDGDEELARYLQVVAGYCLTGVIDEHAMFMAIGSGWNGKSTFGGTLRDLLGDYAVVFNTNMLMFGRMSDLRAREQIGNLQGARFALGDELDEKVSLREGIVKTITAEPVIRGVRPHKKDYDFETTFKVFIYGQSKPRILGTNEGIWRRIKIIPFRVTIPKDDRKPPTVLRALLAEEYSGILNWALRGLDLWLEKGELPHSMMVSSETEEYRTEQDVQQLFLMECTEQGSKYWVTRDAIWGCLNNWCAKEKVELTFTRRAFVERMKKLGFRYESSSKKFFKIRLIQERE